MRIFTYKATLFVAALILHKIMIRSHFKGAIEIRIFEISQVVFLYGVANNIDYPKTVTLPFIMNQRKQLPRSLSF